jgi:hypothetical protein
MEEASIQAFMGNSYSHVMSMMSGKLVQRIAATLRKMKIRSKVVRKYPPAPLSMNKKEI